MAKKDVDLEPDNSNEYEDFTFENREKPPEEEKLTKEKQKEVEEEEEQEEQEQEEEEQEEQVKEQKEVKSFGMLGSIISIGWNLIATPKGYEPINEEEGNILREVWTPVELKYLGSLNSPELQAVVITGTVLIPKYMKAKKNPQVKTEEIK